LVGTEVFDEEGSAGWLQVVERHDDQSKIDEQKGCPNAKNLVRRVALVAASINI